MTFAGHTYHTLQKLNYELISLVLSICDTNQQRLLLGRDVLFQCFPKWDCALQLLHQPAHTHLRTNRYSTSSLKEGQSFLHPHQNYFLTSQALCSHTPFRPHPHLPLPSHYNQGHCTFFNFPWQPHTPHLQKAKKRRKTNNSVSSRCILNSIAT